MDADSLHGRTVDYLEEIAAQAEGREMPEGDEFVKDMRTRFNMT